MDDWVSQSRRGREVDSMQAGLRGVGACSLLMWVGVAAATTPFGATLDETVASAQLSAKPVLAAIADDSGDRDADLDGKFVVLTNSDEAAWCDCCVPDCSGRRRDSRSLETGGRRAGPAAGRIALRLGGRRLRLRLGGRHRRLLSPRWV